MGYQTAFLLAGGGDSEDLRVTRWVFLSGVYCLQSSEEARTAMLSILESVETIHVEGLAAYEFRARGVKTGSIQSRGPSGNELFHIWSSLIIIIGN